MKAREIRAQAREDMSGKWGKFIGLNLLYALITIVLMVIVYMPMIGSFVGLISDAAKGITPTEVQLTGTLGSLGITYLLLFVFLIVMVPMGYAVTETIMNIKRDGETKVTSFFKRIFPNFGRAWKVTLWMMLKILVGYIVLIVTIILAAVLSVIIAALKVQALEFLIALILIVGYVAAFVFLFAKILSLVLSVYVAIDNPEMTAKESVDKSVELMKGYRWKYVCLSLSFIGWAILSVFTFYTGFIFLTPYMQVADICFYENILEEKE